MLLSSETRYFPATLSFNRPLGTLRRKLPSASVNVSFFPEANSTTTLTLGTISFLSVVTTPEITLDGVDCELDIPAKTIIRIAVSEVVPARRNLLAIFKASPRTDRLRQPGQSYPRLLRSQSVQFG